jgi:hypothetical protein
VMIAVDLHLGAACKPPNQAILVEANGVTCCWLGVVLVVDNGVRNL